MNLKSKVRAFLLLLSLMPLSAYSLHAQNCGTLSFGEIQVEADGFYSIEVFLAGVSPFISLEVEVEFPFASDITFDISASNATTPPGIGVSDITGGSFTPMVKFTGGSTSLPNDLLGKVFFTLPFPNCISDIEFKLPNLIFTEDIGGCSPAEFTIMDMETEYCLPDRVISGLVEGAIQDGHVADAKVSVFYSPESGNIEGSTNANGFLSISAPTGNLSMTIDNELANAYCSVTTFDIIELQKHILGTEPFSSVGSYIAADANGDDALTTLDLIGIRKVILAYPYNQSAHRNWEFIPSEFYFSMGLPSSLIQVPVEEVDYPTSLLIPEGDNDQYGAGFAGIKICDVNGTCAASGGRDAEFNSYILETVELTDQSFLGGEKKLVPVYVAEDTEQQFFSYTLNFSEAHFEVSDVVGGQLQDFDAQAFRIDPRDPNRVQFIWFPYDLNAQALNTEEPLFYIELEAKTAVSSLEGLVEIEDLDNVGQGRNYDYKTTLSIVGENNQEYRSVKVLGNPFYAAYQLEVYLPVAADFDLQLVDLQGREVHRSRYALNEGLHILNLSDLTDLPAGHYIQQLTFKDEVLTSPIIKQ